MSKARVTGTEWESRCVRYLIDQGYYVHAERRALAGAKDRGDLVLGPGLMCECKGGKQIHLAQYMKEVDAQTLNCPEGTIGFAWVKAPRLSIDRSYIVTSPKTWFDLVLPKGG